MYSVPSTDVRPAEPLSAGLGSCVCAQKPAVCLLMLFLNSYFSQLCIKYLKLLIIRVKF